MGHRNSRGVNCGAGLTRSPARYYIVVSAARTTRYWAWGALLAGALTVQGVPATHARQVVDPSRRLAEIARAWRTQKPTLPSLLPATTAWTRTLPSPPAGAGAIDNRRLYIPLRDGSVTALDRETGDLLWTRSLEGASTLALGNGLVFAGTATSLVALMPADGSVRWSVALERPLTAPLSWDSDRLYALGAPGEVLAFRPQGELAWRRVLGAPASHPVVGAGGDTAILALADGRLMALSSDTGEVRWERQIGGTLSTPATTANRILVGSTDNFVYAFDRDGSLEWRRRTGGDVSGITANDTMAYIASLDNVIWAVEIGSGNQRWKRATPTRPTFPPALVGGSLVVPGARPAVTSLGATTGVAQGSLTAPGELAGPPLLGPEMQPFSVALVTITREGVVDAVRPNSLTFREGAPAPVATLPGRVLVRERLP